MVRQAKKFRHKLRLTGRIAVLLLLAAFAAAGSYWVYVRIITTNFHAVIPGVVYRSAQPTPKHLEKWVRRYGIRSVINLRGRSSDSHYTDEVEAAARLGLELISVRFSANRHPSSVQLQRLIEALETLPRPILLHCRDGSDRTGVAGVVAAMAIGDQDYQQAKAQLSPVYLHIDGNRDHIAGLMVEYEQHCQKSGVTPGPWEHFRSWAMKEYKPLFYNVELRCPDWPGELSARMGEKIVVKVTMKNCSQRTLPLADAKKEFFLVATVDFENRFKLFQNYCGQTPLPKRDLAPGESICIEGVISTPGPPGVYDLYFDIWEKNVTFFTKEGSPMIPYRFIVLGEPVATDHPATPPQQQ